MKKLSLMAMLGLSAFALLYSCKKSNLSDYSSLYDLRSKLGPQRASIEVDALTGGTFNLGRVRVTVPANAFVKFGGGAVSGKVTLMVTDVLNKGEMIFSAMPVTSTDALVSGGEVEVEAFQDGLGLKLQAGKSVEVKVPQFGKDASGMAVFMPVWLPDSSNGQATFNNANFTWLERKNGSLIINNDTVTLFVDTLGWMNIDRFLNNPNYQSFTVTITGVNVTASSQVFVAALYDQYNGAWQIRDGSGNVYHEGHLPNIPVHFVAYTVVDGKLYGGINPATPATGGNYQINLTEMNPTDFKAQLAKL